MCYSAGMCLCTDSNRKFVAFGKGLDKALSPMCPAFSSSRAQLARGEVVLLFVGQSRNQCSDLAEAADLVGCGEPCWSVAHIAKHTLSSWQSTYEAATCE